MIVFRNVSLRRGSKVLLKELNCTIFHKQRIGIIGANGSGKSSLFAMLLNELQPDVGDLEIPKQLKFAHVAQETPALAMSAVEFVLEGDHELHELQQKLKLAELHHDGIKIAELHEKLGIIDGYSAEARAEQLLVGLGFAHHELHKSVAAFSGGWRVRLNLAKALFARSDVLLLDEPTNHLDLDAVLWLEQFLINYRGTLLLISHDRDFLDHTVDYIAHINQQTLKIYSGNYSTFEKQRAADLLLQQATFEKQQHQLAHMQAFVDRFRYKASKAKQAQSRLKAIERMDLVCAVQTESAFQFAFKQPKSCLNPLIQLENASINYGDKTVLNNINLAIAPLDRITMLGPNGAGKSSLIKLLADELKPSSGVRTAAAGLKIGYFAQHQVDQLNLNESAYQHLMDIAPNVAEMNLRKFLGSFGFSGERIFEAIKNFSGGEKARLALALLVWQEPNLLLLDEPTNHLDLDMRSAMSIALQEFAGAMVLVTHDRFLVRSTTDRLLLVADGKVENFDGDLNDYQRWLLDYRKMQINPEDDKKKKKSTLSKKEQRQQDAVEREKRRPLLEKITQLENEISKKQRELKAIEMKLADSSIYETENKLHLQSNLQTQAQIKKEIENLENSWLKACEERDLWLD